MMAVKNKFFHAYPVGFGYGRDGNNKGVDISYVRADKFVLPVVNFCYYPVAYFAIIAYENVAGAFSRAAYYAVDVFLSVDFYVEFTSDRLNYLSFYFVPPKIYCVTVRRLLLYRCPSTDAKYCLFRVELRYPKIALRNPYSLL